MEPETHALDPSARLLLIDVRLAAGRGQVRLGRGLTGVLAGPQSRSDAAHWIALTIAGPRPAEADGSVEISGEVRSVRTLPDLLLPPGTPAVINRTVVRGHWQTMCARRRDELAAMHASHRLEGHRLDAAIEQARIRLPDEAEPEAPAPEPPPFAATPPAPELDAEDPADEDAALRAELRELLRDLDAIPAGALPEGLLLAEAWDAHAALVRVREAVGDVPGVDVAALEQRVDAARADPAVNMLDIPDAVREHIEQCHRTLVEIEPNLVEGKRKERKRAINAYEEAVAAELVALADVGIESYTSFLELTGGESGPTAAERSVARAELAAARAALDEALQIPDIPTRAELRDRGGQMRERATELLGRAPGRDATSELRALRAETPERAEKLEQIAEVLRDAGFDLDEGAEACAREFVLPPAAPAALPPARVAEVDAPADDPQTGVADVADMERQRAEHFRLVEELEADLARLDAVSTTDVTRLRAADLGFVLERLLEAYRAGEVLEGQLPLVFDGVLDSLPADVRDAAVRVLADATDVQAIVVSDDPEVLQSVAYAGGTLVRWPEPAASSS